MSKFTDYSIIEDAIDVHIHVGPDYSPRYSDSITLAEEAAKAKMKAIIVKTHLASTVASAHAASRVVEGVKVFGGIALNEPCGGLSPRVVMATVLSGGKMIWLPTVDAAYNLQKAGEGHWIKHYVNGSVFGYSRNAITITDENGDLKEEVHEILRICKEKDAILGSGHVSPEECLTLAKEANKIGYDKLEITHPNAWIEDFTIDVMKELAALGATLSLSWGACSPHNGRLEPEVMVDIIKKVGAENLIIMTDYGQPTHPSPAEGLRCCSQLMMNMGVRLEEINQMIKVNPARLLSL